MNPVAFHFAGGDAFFSGSVLILSASLVALRKPTRRRGVLLRLAGILGGILVLLSATPLPLWLYGLWGLALMGWLILSAKPTLRNRKSQWLASGAAAMFCIVGVAWESPKRFAPSLPHGRWSELAVIGDSISAGMLGPEEQTWPQKFREKYRVPVIDVSHVGATARSAIKQAQSIQSSDALVLVEIGGNDLLGSTTAAQFALDLDELLQTARQSGRNVVMLELPLPPFYNEFGRVQREVSARHDVALISKRRFAAVLASHGATLDGLHLSQTGHRLMADMVWQQIGSSLKPPSPKL